jgi:hypothetical protein
MLLVTPIKMNFGRKDEDPTQERERLNVLLE